MAEERDDEQFGETEGKSGQQQTTGQQGQQSEFGQGQQSPTGQESQQPTDEQGKSSSGQTDAQGGAGTFTADQISSGGNDNSGESGSQQGFIGSQGSGRDDLVQDEESSSDERATGGSDFANQGQGAQDNDEGETGESGGGSGGGGGSSF